MQRNLDMIVGWTVLGVSHMLSHLDGFGDCISILLGLTSLRTQGVELKGRNAFFCVIRE